MEFGSVGGSGGGGDWDHESSDPQKRKKKFHRHTAYQIQKLEEVFKECPHPDEKQRLQLSRELGLTPRQIKFWFQNRRTQMKAQHERADNCALRMENDKIRCENIAIREALKNVICPSCGGPPATDSSFVDEQKLRMENTQLKEELDRVSSVAAKYIGRPISQLYPLHAAHISSLDLSMASFGGQGTGGPSLDLDLDVVPAASSNFYFQPLCISDMDRSLMTDIAANAMNELLRLLQNNEPFWIKSSTDGRDVLNLESYQTIFPRVIGVLKNPNVLTEATRDSGVVVMSGLTLVSMFMDSNKWAELFPSIISMAKTIEVISPGVLESHSGCLQLIYEELHVLSPLVPTREFCILRYCQQIEEGLWAIVNVSYDIPQISSHCQSHRLPSGCLIQDMSNGCSKVTWVEHVEADNKTPIHQFYRDLVHSGMAFGAERWLGTLKRSCERFSCQMALGTSTWDTGGVIPSPDGKRSMMKLAQRMVKSFCASVSTSKSHQRTTFSGLNEVGIRVTLHKSMDSGQPNGVILSAATTFSIPVSPQNVFNFFKDERTRPQWDVLCCGNAVQEVAHIEYGSHSGNAISVLRAFNSSQNNMLILQESCIDPSGALVVYFPVDLPAINIVMSGEDPSYIPLFPSGFTISPDGHRDHGDCASTSSIAHGSMGHAGGSLITVAFQILMSNLPSAKLNMESVTTVNNLIGTTVQQIKAALNCSSS